MSYEHVLVSKLTNPPAQGDLHHEEQSANFPWKLDGAPVRKELYDLGMEMRRSFSGYRFHASRLDGNKLIRITYADAVEKLCFTSVNVYIDGSDYVVGQIGYGKNFGMSEAKKATYMVRSRKIQNDKFSDRRDQYYMSFVGDFKKAVKLALTKCTPYSAKEMAALSMYDFKMNMAEERSKINRSLRKIIEPLTTHDVLLTEMKGLITQGVQFTTPAFINASKEIIKAEQEWEAVRNKPMHGYYVYVRMVGDKQWVDVVEIRNMDGGSWSHVASQSPQTSFPIEELPEDIQGKVAVLAMASLDQYMPGVGRRVSEKSFWIERDV